MENKTVAVVGFLTPYVKGGSFRPVPLMRNLARYGWTPIAISPSPHVELPFRVIPAEFGGSIDKIGTEVANRSKTVKPLLHLAGEVLTYPSLYRGWIKASQIALEAALKQGNIDAVISCAPIASHIAVSSLKRKYGFKWVADFPDLWSLNHNYSYSQIRHWFDERKERSVLKDVNAVTTTSQEWAVLQETIVRRVTPIPHGFDELGKALSFGERFNIVYTGTVYQPQALPLFRKANLPQTIDVEFYNTLTQSEARKKQREAQVLLILDWNGNKGVLPYKLFEYLAAQRPILAVGMYHDSALARILKETKAGVYCSDALEIEDVLRHWYKLFQYNGYVPYEGRTDIVMRYSANNMAKRFADVLNGL